MKRMAAFGLFFLLACYAIAQHPEKELRTLFYKASDSPEQAKVFARVLSETENSSPLTDGYRAMSCFLAAKQGYNPYAKWSAFQEGVALLEKAIAKAPENVELRFLRFSVQTNAPSMLAYSNAIELDKNRLLDYLESEPADKDLYFKIRDYMSARGFYKENFRENEL